MSANELFGQIIREFGGPVAAPSANRFGRISPTSAQDVRDELDRRIPLIIDGGRTTLGIESTVVAVGAGEIEILRRGPISAEQLARIAPVTFRESSGRPKSPGQLASHYAPRTPLRLVRRADALKIPKNARYGLLSWGAKDTGGFAEVRRLSRKHDVAEAAANLFHLLRDLDSYELDLIVAEQVPDEGIGSAIMDRLRRAATRA
jgi:L-threonylcarbamoyladenylate synthase